MALAQSPRDIGAIRIRRIAAGAALGVLIVAGPLALADEMVQLDPFAQATSGDAACPAPPPPLLTAEAARTQAHVRVERGLRCAMEGKCEPGGAYKRDPEINERVRALIAGDRHYADTAVWVTTTRKWVTLQGCVRTPQQRKALVARVAQVRDVERVFDELAVRKR
jgi:hypothetical protein